ncbi:MAG TPA: extracellular solute-binding protein [Candidatus Avipropionibacterium avicola]|uniref:Extracellular solute-binding protein n=1 Tax=Candidatus Avipropionibacterium avicola TaxID=2840701 RepID=A0A9D1GZM8_9ACTN|nr:extracellular solute-binding protein [Candidatus Avipropionibacterium avicola]
MISRRRMLGAGGAGLAAAGLGLAGCRSDNQGGGGSGSEAAAFETPTYQAYTGVEPTLPALDNGTSPYFEAFPSEMPTFSTAPPGSGSTVRVHTFLNSSPRPVEDNQWWQALNEATGVTFELTGAPIGDYPSKFQTVMAGGEVDDLTSILPDSTPELAKLLEATFQDLTDYVSGDAILEYPGLANIPSVVWDACTYNGRIYTLPIHRFALTHGYAVRTDVAEERGAPTEPKNGEEFYEMFKALSDPAKGTFATNNAVWLVEIVAEMMGVPNDWGIEGGKFVKDIEVPQYLEALEFVRRCWEEKMIHPSAWEANFSLQTQDLYNEGTAPFVIGGLTWMGNAANAEKLYPEARSNTFTMMKWDGSGPAERYVGGGAPYQTALKKGDDARIKELLGVINWLASPFGTKEYRLFRNGIEGRHYELDSDGNTVPIEDNKVENMGPLIYAGSAPQVHNSLYPHYSEAGYHHEAEAMDHALVLPTLSLESETGQTKNAQLNKLLTDARSDIITGRKPVSSWADTIENWKSKGGDKVRQEYEESLAAQE